MVLGVIREIGEGGVEILHLGWLVKRCIKGKVVKTPNLVLALTESNENIMYFHTTLRKQ